MVVILLGTGFEEIEAVAPCDLLRRAGVDAKFVGLNGKTVVGSHGITLLADLLPEELDYEQIEMVVLPGGLRGVQSILADAWALDFTKKAWDAGKYVAAICAAPTVLARLGIVGKAKATCYPGKETEMGEADMQPLPAVIDGRLITGRSAGSALDFGLALIRVLRDDETAARIARGVVYPAT